MSLFAPPIPVFKQLSDFRDCLHIASHEDTESQDYSLGQRVGFWLGHKVVTTICIAASLVEGAVGVAGCAFSVCTLGAIKVSIFAITLGNIKPNFPTGFIWFAKRVAYSLSDEITNASQLIRDVADILYQSYRFSRWVAHQLHFGDFFSKIFRQLGKLFNCIYDRISLSIAKVAAAEEPCDFKTPFPIKLVNDLTKMHRIDFESQDRSLTHIFKHYVLSVANIPLNAITAVGAGAASIVLGSLFVAKVALHATTNIHVPVPTYVGKAGGIAAKTALNTIKDVGCDIADGYVLLYKTSNALGISKAATNALRVVAYIPEAIFS